MTAALFVLGVMLLAALMLSVRRHRSASAVRLVVLAMPLWLVYVGLLSCTGVVSDATLRPPGVLFILLPVCMFIGLFAVRSAGGLKVAVSFPRGVLIGAQVFRVPVKFDLTSDCADAAKAQGRTFEPFNLRDCRPAGLTEKLNNRTPTDGRHLAFIRAHAAHALRPKENPCRKSAK